MVIGTTYTATNIALLRPKIDKSRAMPLGMGNKSDAAEWCTISYPYSAADGGPPLSPISRARSHPALELLESSRQASQVSLPPSPSI